MATLRLEGVTRLASNSASSSAIVKDISFTVPDGQFWALVGPSGCGKSTILRLIAGLLSVSAGRIFLGERRMDGVPARQRDVAMVFQNYALYPHMTVAQNLGFGLKMRGTSSAVRSQQVEGMAAALGLSDLLTRKPAQLSGGQQQRVALGRALVRQPQVFLLDEPLSNLDAQLRDETRSELKHLHQQFGVTTLYVTHDQIEAMTLADQLIVLDRGEIQQIGPPLEVYANPQNVMVAGFLGSPPMNLLVARYEQAQLWVGAQALRSWENASVQDGTPVILGIRPEQIQLSEVGFPLQVTAIEPLGREILVQGRWQEPTFPAQSLSFFVAPQQLPQFGAQLTVRMGTPWVVFDQATGVRLGEVECASIS